MYVSNRLGKAESRYLQCRGESIFVPVSGDTYEKLERGVALWMDSHAISNNICILNNFYAVSVHPYSQFASEPEFTR